MSAASAFLMGERLRTLSLSREERKGIILSHLLGFCLFSELTLNFVKFEVPLTPVAQIPIRLVALWLILDRNWRVGRFRFGTWDWLILGFVALTGIGVLATATFSPELPVALEDYRRFVGVFLGAYVYYLVMKEGLCRKGFRPDIAINWLLAGFAVSALVGIAQSLNLPHIRELTARMYQSRSELAARQIALGSQASGTAAHSNQMAFEMLVAFAVAFGPSFRRKPHWWEVALGMLFMTAFICTESRGGLVAFAACSVGTVFFFWWNRKPKKALLIGVIVGVAVIIWGFAVFALKVERFTRTIEGEKVRGSVYLQSIDSRIHGQLEALRIGMKRPMFGTGPNSLLFPGSNVRVSVYSTSSIMGVVDGQYGLAFAQFGLVGTAMIAAMFFYMISFIRRKAAFRPYAMTIFLIGIAITTHGLVEFLIYARVWIVIHSIVALASSPLLVSESGRAMNRRGVPIRARIEPGPRE